MSNIWISSDFHYNHSNIVKGISKWEGGGQRDFQSLEEHNQTLIDNINKCAKEGDELWFLGDWSFGGVQQVYNFRKQLVCKTIHLIYGNHDHHIENNRLIVLDSGQEVSCRTLFRQPLHVRNGKIGGHKYFLSHYSHRTWPNAHHGQPHLYGHSHGSLEDYHRYSLSEEEEYTWGSYGVPETAKYKCMDIGIDTHPEFRPYHIDEIRQVMKNRINLSIDHHNEQIN